jgi:ATP-dependent exoDNAse (exonuclease V) beta subunit
VRALQQSLAGVKVRAVELPLLLARDGVVWRGSADLVFEDGGELVVGDWKSDRVGDDDASAQELATRYRPQLELYRDALAAALAPGGPGRAAKPPRIELLLLRTGRRLAL